MGIACRQTLAIVLCILLAGCTTPRGAGFQAEVLAAQDEGESAGLPPDFSVHPVTRASLPQLAAWPGTGQSGHSWIARQSQPASLIIAPGDILAISVWDTEDNSLLAGPGQRVAELANVQVSPAGAIFLPFVGEMKVSGMAVPTARAKIEEKLIASIPAAQVQLSVTPGRANTANLVSGVTNPGVYPLPDRDYSLLSLLAQGGGVQAGLKNPQIKLFRGSQVYATSVARLYEDPAMDTTMVGGDRVIVEADKRYFLSLGAAGTEAIHNFPQDRVTALDAMSIVGGVQDTRADPKGILILREYPAGALRQDGSGPAQKRVVFSIDLTTADGLFSAGQFAVMPKDLVYVSESRITSARTVLGLFGIVLGLGNQVGN